MKNFIKICTIFFGFIFCIINVKAQDTTTLKTNKTFYSFSFGFGTGDGYLSDLKGIKIGGQVAFSIKKRKDIIFTGIRAITDITLFSNNNVENNVKSIEIGYGRCIFKKGIFSINAYVGLSQNEFVQKGKLISSISTGFLSSNQVYEKLSLKKIGFPTKVDIYLLDTNEFAVGFEFFANLNSIKHFYGVNMNFIVGRLNFSKKVKNKK